LNFFDDCNPIDCALEITQDLGLNISKIGILTRIWDGAKLGTGTPTDSLVLFSPMPRIKQVRLTHSNKEGGLEKRGDLLIKMISLTAYPLESSVNCISDLPTKELYYYVDGEIYEVVEITKKISWWNVLIKKAKKRILFLP